MKYSLCKTKKCHGTHLLSNCMRSGNFRFASSVPTPAASFTYLSYSSSSVMKSISLNCTFSVGFGTEYIYMYSIASEALTLSQTSIVRCIGVLCCMYARSLATYPHYKGYVPYLVLDQAFDGEKVREGGGEREQQTFIITTAMVFTYSNTQHPTQTNADRLSPRGAKVPLGVIEFLPILPLLTKELQYVFEPLSCRTSQSYVHTVI